VTTWPAASIPVFPAGYKPVQSDFASWIQDTLGFLTGGVVFRARQTTAQALSGGANIMQYQAIDEDPYSGWSAVATGSQPAYSWLAPYTGLYQITVTTAFAASNNWTDAGALLTGTLITLSECATTNLSGVPAGAGGMVTVPMTGGADYLQVNVAVANADDTVITAGSEPSVEIALVSQ